MLAILFNIHTITPTTIRLKWLLDISNKKLQIKIHAIPESEYIIL